MDAPECTASINKSPSGSSNEVSGAATRRTTRASDKKAGLRAGSAPEVGLQPSGLKTRTGDGGFASSFDAGRRGRGSNSPAQFGHWLFRRRSAQVAQNVHSNEQIRASGDSGGKSASQHSQDGRISSMAPRTAESKRYGKPSTDLLDTVLDEVQRFPGPVSSGFSPSVTSRMCCFWTTS